MLDFRLDALAHLLREGRTPSWAGSPEAAGAPSTSTTSATTFAPPTSDASDWDDVPEYIKDTFDKLGIPEAERQFLAGAGAQYDSEVVYHNIREDLEKQGVIFLSMDQGLAEHEDIVREHFGTLIPPGDNKYSALNSAVWSGGSFIYVPPGVKRGRAAAGLLPHQHREHGPVRAHADRRRRGRVRALRGGLHGAHLQHRLAALGGGRDRGRRRTRACATRRSRTGRTTSTTW